jgi:hypothetical protein
MKRMRSIIVFCSLLCVSAPPLLEAAAPPVRILPTRPVAYSRYGASMAQRVVTVPAGTAQVVLERREGTGWRPLEVWHPDFAPNERTKNLAISLPRGVPLGQVRVAAYAHAKFPAGFKTGSTQFEHTEEDPGVIIAFGDTIGTNGTTFLLNGTGLRADMVASTANNLAVAGSANSSTATTVENSPVLEADIWKVVGSRLFFFNQYRGLQVFELSDPAAPVRTGGLRLPASGDQLLVLDDSASTVALLGRQTNGSEALFIVRIQNGVPALVSQTALAGTLLDSRLIGNRLHLLTQAYASSADTDPQAVRAYVNGLPLATLRTLDLSDSAAPAEVGSIAVGPSWSSFFQASGGYLLVSTRDYDGCRLNVIDPHAGAQAPTLLKSMALTNPIQDKFKMAIVEGAAVAVTQPDFWAQRQTWIETFSLDPSQTGHLAEVEIEGARGESLRATRFDGDRLYVVTVFVAINYDPLFVIDLSNPAQPLIGKGLEIPGWSNFLQPDGDRLVSVGVDSNRVAISLYDVADLQEPRMLSRLLLGSPTWSASEANTNEKAVSYDPETGLLMVPFQDNRQKSFMQVIKVSHDGLAAGAAIPHGGLARRGVGIGDYLVSISGTELQVNKRASTIPTAVAKVSLAWRVDRVLPVGNFLLQVTDGASPNYFAASSFPSQPMLRITRRDDPDALLAELEIGEGRIVGATQMGSRLYIAQWISAHGWNKAKLRTWILEAGKAPDLREVAAVDHALADAASANLDLDAVEAVWVKDTLVWAVPMQEWSPYRLRPLPIYQPVVGIGIINIGIDVTTGVVSQNLLDKSIIASPAILPPAKGLAMLLCPVLSPAKAASAGPVIQIVGSPQVSSVSRPVSLNGYLFLSYDEREPLPVNAETFFRYQSRVRSALQVIDFNATPPIVRSRVAIPGELLAVKGADAQGAVLLTHSGGPVWSDHTVHASAYDGTHAFELDARSTPSPRESPFAVRGTDCYFTLSFPFGITGVGYDSASGKLADLGQWKTLYSPFALQVVNDRLLTAQYTCIQTAKIAADGSLVPEATFPVPAPLTLRISGASEDAGELLIPAEDYGVEVFQIPTPVP